MKDKVLNARKELLDRHTNPYDHDHIVSGQVERQNPMPSAIEKGPTDVLKSLGIQAQNPIAGKHSMSLSKNPLVNDIKPDDVISNSVKKPISKPGIHPKVNKKKG